MLALDGKNDWVLDVLNGWIDGSRRRSPALLPRRRYGNTFRAVEDALPACSSAGWRSTSTIRLDFALRDMADVKALEMVPKTGRCRSA